MAKVHLRKITRDNLRECLALQVDDWQKCLVATTAQSLAEAYVNSNLFPFAVYEAFACGYEQPEVPMVGFTMYEIVAGVGFIMRLMIDRKHQRRGYGRATMLEVIRRLKLCPDIEQAKDVFPVAKRVLLTAYADTDAAIESINSARLDYYLLKPWDPPEERLYPVLDDLLDDWIAAFRPTL